jgi:hypothetical protein
MGVIKMEDDTDTDEDSDEDDTDFLDDPEEPEE